MSRIIGLDHGRRRIGVAIGDTETGLAFARPAIRARSAVAADEAVASLARTERAALLVLGLPRAPDGGEGEQAVAVRAFGERLIGRGLLVAYVDERLTSWQAAEELAAIGRRPSRRGGELDSAAARLVLQEYLDTLRSPRDPTL
ncbi:MAG: Holliday junction resolvase RuvX [Gammaproteobacteria bacterium]